MNRFQLARLAGLICLAGGVLQIIYGLLAIPFPPTQPMSICWAGMRPCGHLSMWG